MNPPPAQPLSSRVFPTAFGALLGLALVKFGNPVILGGMVDWPEDAWQWVFFAWPVAIAYPLMLAVALLGVWVARLQGFGALAKDFRLPPLWLAAAWLAWQFVAATGSVDPRLTQWTLAQLASAVICFMLGYASLGVAGRLTGFWVAMLAGFTMVLMTGWEQHFGGLEESRKHFLLYVQPGMKEVPPELMKRMTSGRIFGTLFYPNTLATVILLLLPPLLAFLWSLKTTLTSGARLFLMAVLALAALACLVWSGSKGGWLVMLLLGLVALLQLRFGRRWKISVVGFVLAAGLAGFFWRYAAFFEKGATSVGARFDYWQAAVQNIIQHPLAGSGPGTFGTVYKQIKRPDSEMSRMTHNDYLQQGSDSGLPGMLAYAGFVVLALAGAFPGRRHPASGIASTPTAPNWPLLSVWLGLLGWAVQSLFEFPLYIPATAWLAFALLGWLLRQQVLAKGSRFE